MSTYALLSANPRPTDAQIAEGLSGNICRCGEYTKIYTSVHNAAAMMRGEQVTHQAPTAILYAPIVQPQAPAAAAAAPVQCLQAVRVRDAVPTLEEFEPLASSSRSGQASRKSRAASARSRKWDSSKLDEAESAGFWRSRPDGR